MLLGVKPSGSVSSASFARIRRSESTAVSGTLTSGVWGSSEKMGSSSTSEGLLRISSIREYISSTNCPGSSSPTSPRCTSVSAHTSRTAGWSLIA